MIVRRIHARGGQGRQGFLGQLADMIGAAGLSFEALVFSVFVLGHEIAAGAAVTGDGEGFALREFLVAAEVLGELRCGDFDHGRRSPVCRLVYKATL